MVFIAVMIAWGIIACALMVNGEINNNRRLEDIGAVIGILWVATGIIVSIVSAVLMAFGVI